MAVEQGALPGLAPLFEELSNPIRLALLSTLVQGPAHVTRLGEALGLSPQEISRHLARLAALDLVQRGPSRAYVASPFGRVLVEELPAFGALLARRGFFQSHRLEALPDRLPMRPLAAAGHTRASESENMERAMAALGRAERRVAYVGNQLGWVAEALRDRALAGAEVEALLPWTMAGSEGLLALDERLGPEALARFRVSLVHEAPLLLAATEREAFAFFALDQGAIDFSHLVHGEEPGFVAWAETLLRSIRGRAVPAFDPRRHGPEDWRRAITVAASHFVDARRRATMPTA